MTDSCAALTWRGYSYADTPSPDELCDNDAEPGSDYCTQHREDDDE